MTRHGPLIAVPSHRVLRRVAVIAASVFAVGALIATTILTVMALDPTRVTTHPSLTPITETPVPVVASPPITATAGDQTYRLDLPDVQPRGLVVLFPDAGADPATLLGGEGALALQDAGWAVATTEFHGTSWGSPQSSEDVEGLLDWASGYVEPAPLVLVSEGMGATTSLLAMSRSSSVGVTCWFAVDPRTDLLSIARADPATEEQIVSAWGRTPKPAELPLAVAASLPLDALYRFAEVAADTPETLRQDAAAMSAALESSGHDVATVPGNGRDPAVLVQMAQECTP